MGCLCRNFHIRCDRQFQYTLVFLYICVKTHNVHRNKKCSVFHICLFCERYDFCDFDIGCSGVSTNFVEHRSRFGHPLFFSVYRRPTDRNFWHFLKKSNDIVTPFFTWNNSFNLKNEHSNSTEKNKNKNMNIFHSIFYILLIQICEC